MKELIYYPSSQKVITENYPYGFKLRTTKTDWVEFKPKHGFRRWYQTIDPRNGRVNIPKAGTYYPCMLLAKDPENGHLESLVLDFNGLDSLTESCKVLGTIAHYFTKEEVRYLFKTILLYLRVEMSGSVHMCGAKFKDLVPLFYYSIKAACEGIESGDRGLFQEIFVDPAKVKEVEPEGFSPFRTITYNI